jgi:hypothetical protein
LRVEHVGLATRALLDVPGVDEHQLEVVLGHRPRPPVDARGLHRDLPHTERLEPVAQREQPLHRGAELGDLLLELVFALDVRTQSG